MSTADSDKDSKKEWYLNLRERQHPIPNTYAFLYAHWENKNSSTHPKVAQSQKRKKKEKISKALINLGVKG